jgi:hypothetical protein
MRVRLWLQVITLLVLCGLAVAQDGGRSVQGVVTDSSGAPLEGAVVQLKDTKTLQIRSFLTRPDGSYRFVGLGANVEYQLRADYQGASSKTETLSAFNENRTVTINLRIDRK